MSLIELQNLTKDYGSGRGVFDLNFKIEKGEMLGFVGANGSGKTTTIRSIMGFIKPSKGHCYVDGLESWDRASDVARLVGYVPGEIAFPDLKTGTAFLKSQAEFFGLKDLSYAMELVNDLQLDPRANLKRMSKGMKQKTALVAALMNNQPILIMDEPTTGLDPLMRETFLKIVKNEHKKGKTIFMSSNTFQEIEDTCDKVALISDGHIIDIVKMEDIYNRSLREFKIEFYDEDDYQKFISSKKYQIIRLQAQYHQATIEVKKEDLNKMLLDLRNYRVKFISEIKYSLERYFREVMMKVGKEKEYDVIEKEKAN